MNYLGHIIRLKKRRLQKKLRRELSREEKLQQLRERIEDLNRQIEAAEQRYDLEKAAELKYGRLPETKRQLDDMLVSRNYDSIS